MKKSALGKRDELEGYCITHMVNDQGPSKTAVVGEDKREGGLCVSKTAAVGLLDYLDPGFSTLASCRYTWGAFKNY